MTTEVDGLVAPGFEKVADAFARNFAEHGEVGAGFAVHVEGELVVDICGGLADPTEGTAWGPDTLQLVFSSTKGVAAICVAMLAQRGALDFDAPVATYWPEFAAQGKQTLTVRQMMSHQGGLVSVDTPLTSDEVYAVGPITKALAEQAPLWPIGSGHGYHALTFGWLVGELIARVDGRRINQFLQEEVVGPLAAEMWIGLPDSEMHRTATLLDAPAPSPEMAEVMAAILGPGTLANRAFTIDGALTWPNGSFAAAANTAEFKSTEMPSANGVTNARSLSAIYGATVADVNGVRLLDADTVADIRALQVSGPDLTLVIETGFRTGFSTLAPMLGPESFGHSGMGGSLGYADAATGVGYGYVMNQMKGLGDYARTDNLNQALRACL